MLLQILDDGRLTDSQGKVVSFKNTIIIMTSNIGARLITEKQQERLGFATADNKSTEEDSAVADFERTKELVMGELKKVFRPEFINRVDDIIVFRKLLHDDIQKIAGKMLEGLKGQLRDMDIAQSDPQQDGRPDFRRDARGQHESGRLVCLRLQRR